MNKDILLVSMPDAALPFDRVVKIPNLGLCSIAGGADNYNIKILDLVVVNNNAGKYLKDALKQLNPSIVGISCMSFQFESALMCAKIIKEYSNKIKIILGGYHVTLCLNETIELLEQKNDSLIDYILTSESDLTFRILCDAIHSNSGFDKIPGLYYKINNSYSSSNITPKLTDLDDINLPNREIRLLEGFHILGKKFDCIETSRGCTMGCNFCSINGMYGKTYREYNIDRVLEDIRTVKQNKSKGIFIIDDNITMNVDRVKKLFSSIIDNGLNDIDYVIQASVLGIIKDPGLARLLKDAGVKIVFLGIENDNSLNLKDLNKSIKSEQALEAVNLLKKNNIVVFGGFIIANPKDNAVRIKNTFNFIKYLRPDHAIVQCLTPYPGTKIREDLIKKNLIENLNDYSKYNGFTCNVKTNHLSQREINNIILTEGFKYYLNPFNRSSSHFLRNYWKMLPRLLMNDFSYLYGAFKGNGIFLSKHRW